LIFGGFTIAWSIVVLFLLPDDPTKAWFFSPTDRVKAIIRVQENMTGIKNDEFKWDQCRETLLDFKTWLIFVIQLASNIPNGGINSVSPTLFDYCHSIYVVLTGTTVWGSC
jgi:hypothetical protein